MNKKINETGLRSIIIVALTALSVIAEVILLITSNSLIPAPFAMFIWLFYKYATDGNFIGMVIFWFLYCASVALSMFSATEKHKDGIAIKIGAALFIAADLGVHSYAFLAGKGYGWNYLISAVLDAVLLVSVIFRAGKKKREVKEEETEVEKG